jgi:hypothetical protein
MDFALVIQYVRILITTKNNIHEAGREALPLNTDDDDNNDDHHNDARRPCPVHPSTINHPNLLWLLIVAAGFHLGGNVVITFFNNQARPYVYNC